MCLLLVSPNGFPELSDALLAAALRHNPHGAGFMWHDGSRLQLKKDRWTTAKTVRAWLAELPADTKAALHLRKATCGAHDIANVHPHLLCNGGAQLAVMHNGSLERWVGCSQHSDTARFTQEWLQPAWHADSDISGMRFGMQLRAVVDPGNRLVLVDGAGRWRVVGEEEGWWLGEMWLSNPKARRW